LASAEEDEESDPVLIKLHGKVTRFLDAVSGDDQQRTLAFDELLKDSQLSKTSDAFKTLLSQSKEIEKKYGKFRESERVATKRVGKGARDLVLLKYLFKCENFPVVWYFTYYRDFSHPSTTTEDENWVIIAVRFDTQLELLDR
jgi:hypothetical protein